MAPVRYQGPERRRTDIFDRWLARLGSIAMLILFAWAVIVSTEQTAAEKRITQRLAETAQETRTTNQVHVCRAFLNQYVIEQHIVRIARQHGFGQEDMQPSLAMHPDTRTACQSVKIPIPSDIPMQTISESRTNGQSGSSENH